MPSNPVLERRERDRRRMEALRIKHGVGMACTLAYGALAAGLYKPVFEQTPMSVAAIAGTLFAMAVLAGSYYVVPMGEYNASTDTR